MKYIKKLVGKNIYLSPVNIEDYAQFTEWLGDFETSDYIGKSASIISFESEQEFLSKAKDKDCFLAIIELSSNSLLGTISLEKIDAVNRTATLGIFIGDKTKRNKGYGTEAIKLLLDFGFNYLNLNNIDLQVYEFNKRAIKCYEKCGFKLYGRRTKSKYINGNYYDLIFMEVLKDDFKESYILNKNQ